MAEKPQRILQIPEDIFKSIINERQEALLDLASLSEQIAEMTNGIINRLQLECPNNEPYPQIIDNGDGTSSMSCLCCRCSMIMIPALGKAMLDRWKMDELADEMLGDESGNIEVKKPHVKVRYLKDETEMED